MGDLRAHRQPRNDEHAYRELSPVNSHYPVFTDSLVSQGTQEEVFEPPGESSSRCTRQHPDSRRRSLLRVHRGSESTWKIIKITN